LDPSVLQRRAALVRGLFDVWKIVNEIRLVHYHGQQLLRWLFYSIINDSKPLVEIVPGTDPDGTATPILE
jgi:hypothetical protein